MVRADGAVLERRHAALDLVAYQVDGASEFLATASALYTHRQGRSWRFDAPGVSERSADWLAAAPDNLQASPLPTQPILAATARSQAIRALSQLESAARGDRPFSREHQALAVLLPEERELADMAEAARIGLINRAVPAEELDAAVDEIVADLLAGGPNAIAASKRLLAEVPGMPVDEAFAWTQRFSAELFTSDEAKEGMGAFLEKRPAAWVPKPDA